MEGLERRGSVRGKREGWEGGRGSGEARWTGNASVIAQPRRHKFLIHFSLGSVCFVCRLEHSHPSSHVNAFVPTSEAVKAQKKEHGKRGRRRQGTGRHLHGKAWPTELFPT